MMETRQCSPLILPDSASGAWVDEYFSPSSTRSGDPQFLVLYNYHVLLLQNQLHIQDLEHHNLPANLNGVTRYPYTGD